MYIANRFYTNPFEKHIDKLEKTSYQLQNNLSTGNSQINSEITADQQAYVDEAVEHLKVAIERLKRLDKRK